MLFPYSVPSVPSAASAPCLTRYAHCSRADGRAVSPSDLKGLSERRGGLAGGCQKGGGSGQSPEHYRPEYGGIRLIGADKAERS